MRFIKLADGTGAPRTYAEVSPTSPLKENI
jgi:hypothetical protein